MTDLDKLKGVLDDPVAFLLETAMPILLALAEPKVNEQLVKLDIGLVWSDVSSKIEELTDLGKVKAIIADPVTWVLQVAMPVMLKKAEPIVTEQLKKMDIGLEVREERDGGKKKKKKLKEKEKK